MPELKQRLRADLTAAMKARDDVRTRTLRMALTSVANEEVAGPAARELTPDCSSRNHAPFSSCRSSQPPRVLMACEPTTGSDPAARLASTPNVQSGARPEHPGSDPACSGLTPF